MAHIITVHVVVAAPIPDVWQCWTHPDHITGWSFASDDWEARNPEVDLRVGGRFTTTLGAKDGSASFDFSGVYTKVAAPHTIEYTLDDGRWVSITFADTAAGVLVTERFEAETIHSVELQQAGWQAFLENFKKYVEGR